MHWLSSPVKGITKLIIKVPKNHVTVDNTVYVSTVRVVPVLLWIKLHAAKKRMSEFVFTLTKLCSFPCSYLIASVCSLSSRWRMSCPTSSYPTLSIPGSSGIISGILCRWNRIIYPFFPLISVNSHIHHVDQWTVSWVKIQESLMSRQFCNTCMIKLKKWEQVSC